MSKYKEQKVNNLHFLCVFHKVRIEVIFSLNFQLLIFCGFLFFPENFHAWQHGIDKLSEIF